MGRRVRVGRLAHATHGTDYQDLGQAPDATSSATATAAANAAHLAGLLRGENYPLAQQ